MLGRLGRYLPFCDNVCEVFIIKDENSHICHCFSEMKDLKVPKTSLVVRRGKYLNGSFTVTFKSHEDIFIKVFTEVMDSFTPEINESSVCESQSLKSNSFRKSQGKMIAEVKRMYKDTFDLEIKKDLKYLAENTIPRLRQGLFLQNV